MLLKNKKLSTKLISVLLAVSVIPLLCVCLSTYIIAQNALSDSIYSKLETFSKQKAAMIAAWSEQKRNAAIAAASAQDIRQSMTDLKAAQWGIRSPEWIEKTAILNKFIPSIIKTYDVSAVMLMDKLGMVVYSTLDSLVGKNLNSNTYFQNATGNLSGTLEVFYSDAAQQYFLPTSCPIYSSVREDEIVGVFVILSHPKDLDNIISHGVEQLGESGDAYLVNKSGIFLTKPKLDSSIEILKSGLEIEESDFLNAIASSDTSFYNQRIDKDYKGSDVLLSEQIIKIGDEFFGGLIVNVKSSEAFAAVNVMRTIILIMSVIIIVLILFAGIAFSNSITRPILSAVQDLNVSAQQVASASIQFSSSSQHLSDGNSQMASSIEETSATLEQSGSMIRQNTENTQLAAQLSSQARSFAEKCNDEMQEMMNTMDEIKKSSDQIAKIIKVIDEIAFQTNILALNAAVEAARAGDAGMGFAVVADEVRNLAQRSAQAARDTAAIIEGNIEMSTIGVKVVRQVADSLAEIMSQSKKVNELMDEISVASQEQSQGIAQITKAISQMEEVTQQNATTAEESASSSEQLSAQAAALKNIVQQLYDVVNGTAAAIKSTGKPKNKMSALSKKTTSLLGGALTAQINPPEANPEPETEFESSYTTEASSQESDSDDSTTHIVNPEEIIPLEDDTKDF